MIFEYDQKESRKFMIFGFVETLRMEISGRRLGSPFVMVIYSAFPFSSWSQGSGGRAPGR
ncbi:MAG: hypothetical protein PHQ81_09165 [Methanofollis sp.]|nr:hypothetical protein [Methanofollis sp.]